MSSASEQTARAQAAQEQASAAYAQSGPAPAGSSGHAAEHGQEPPVVNDKRRIDPQTGELREAATAQEPEAEQVDADGELGQARTALAERTADLQRLKAEFDNYRRRVERDRQATKDEAAGRVLLGLLPTLDDIGRARAHDDLNGTFKTVAEGLENTLTTLGLERYGEQGEPFDPTLHEALVYTSAPGVTGPTCIEVYRPGYRHAGRVLRPAQVVVADAPEGGAGPVPDGQTVPTTEPAGSPESG